MIKLDKAAPKGLLYWEAWNHDGSVVVHEGKVGTKGKTHVHNVAKGETPSAMIRRLSKAPRAEGYSTIPESKHQNLVVQYTIEGRGSAKDLDFRSEVEDYLNNEIGWLGAGHLDGGDIGAGTMNIFLRTVGGRAAVPGVVRALRKKGWLNGAVIAIDEKGPDGDYTVVYPAKYTEPFKS